MNYLLRISTLLISVTLISSCKLNGTLQLVSKMNCKVPEASGLTIRGAYLYAVSDKNGDIYKLDMEGNQIERLKTKTKDVEGITVIGDKFLLADEAQQKLYTYSLTSERLKGTKLDHPKIYNPKSGLEGLTYDTYTNTIFVINEKESGQLLQYDTSFVLIQQNFLGAYTDYSGVTTTKDHIWIISDEGAGLAQYDRNLNLLKLYSLDIDSPEGIAISEEKGLIYIVSDTSSELIIYKLPRV